MFPALNITGIARVELVSRNGVDLVNEALTIYNAIANARSNAGTAPPASGAVLNMHRRMFRIVGQRGGGARACCFTQEFEALNKGG